MYNRTKTHTKKHGCRSTIELYKNELWHDVENTAYIYASGVDEQRASPRRLANVFDINEGGNHDRVSRLMDNAVEDCMEMLYALTRREGRMSYASDEQCEVVGSNENDDESYTIMFSVPDGFSAESVHAMALYAHDYVVYTVLKNWMLLVWPDGVGQMSALADDAAERLRAASRKRARPMRISMCPF